MTHPTRRLPFAAPALVAAAFALAAPPAQADPIALTDPGLPGNTAYSEWARLTAPPYTGYPGFPGSGAWPAPMAAQAGSAGAELSKVANGTGGGPYPASGSIYFGGFSADVDNNGGTLAVSDSAAIAGLQQVSFQIQIGEAWTYDFWNHALPTLSYNGGSQNLAATTSGLLEQYYNGTVDMPTGPEDVYINTYLLNWDLSGIADPITSFSISFTGVQHAQLYKLRVDESDTVATAAVPEPSSLALLACGGSLALLIRRRSARTAV
ncbi:MAG: hypothetical protein BGO49_30160 [Planctomycetales bacterium 71-10]|nr:MAG: hypothetical protein BGO49_30160 [Planctomycetales bacterium 71-10]